MTHIGNHPTPEMYASGLEIDCQCARCGSSMESYSCEECELDWIYDDDDDDDGRPCPDCHGNGVCHDCMSSPEWCAAHPLPGREAVSRGEIEWFTTTNDGR